MKWLSQGIATIDGSFNYKFIGVNTIDKTLKTYYASTINVMIEVINFDMFNPISIKGCDQSEWIVDNQ